MKKLAAIVMMSMLSCSLYAGEQLKVLLLDCKNESKAIPMLTASGISGDDIAQKCPILLSKQLLNGGKYALLDRRDFTAKYEKELADTAKADDKAKPTFIHAAQILNADVVLKSTLMSFSVAKETINQGNIKTELENLTVRVSVEALDVADGTIVCMADGSASYPQRQTENRQVQLSEDDVLQLVEKAYAKVVPDLEKKIEAWQAKAGGKEVKLTIESTADPAIVEIDGMIIGSTPLKDIKVRAGDHVITIGKPGYVDLSKKILFNKDTFINVPMMKKDLSADELKEVLKNARINIISGAQPSFVIKQIEQ